MGNSNTFGSPTMGDNTAKMEQDIEDFATSGIQNGLAMSKQVVPRPLGSVKTPADGQAFDYQTRQPTFWDGMMQQAALQGLKGKAAGLALLQYAAAQERKANA